MRVWAVTGIRIALGALFLWAGAMKLRDPAAFAADIANYRFLPSLSPWVAAAMPMIEIVLGAALIAAPLLWRRAAALGIAGLLIVFTAAVFQAVVRGINLECGCFGGPATPVTAWTVLRDLALLAAAIAVYSFDASMARRTAS